MKKQIVLLAAGASSRFFPFNGTHKSMFVICGKPIIGWTLGGIKKLKIDEVVVVISEADKEIKNYLSNYKGLDIKIAYQKKAFGMADALLSAEELLEESFILGFPHFVNEDIFKLVLEKTKNISSVGVLVEKTNRPWEYGILSYDKSGRAIGVVEKPEKGKEPSDDRISGCYFLNKKFIGVLKNTPESEYQFEAALDTYMKNESVSIIRNNSSVMSLKYPWDLFAIKAYILDQLTQEKTAKYDISPKAVVRGKVVLEDGAKILDFAIVEGPAYLGKNAIVGAFSVLRDYSVLEADAQLERYVDCTRSIIGQNSHVHSGFIGDTIIGKGVRVGAGFITGNKRIDRNSIDVEVKSKKVSTESSRLGALIGDNVKMGINASVMPGIIIGSGSIIGPSTIVMSNLPEKTLFYSEQKTYTKQIK